MKFANATKPDRKSGGSGRICSSPFSRNEAVQK
jgi:hypothetical protein